MNVRSAILSTFAALWIGVTGAAWGALVTVTAVGQVTDVTYENPSTISGSNPFPGLAAGDLVTTSFTYDTAGTFGLQPIGCCSVGYLATDFSIGAAGWSDAGLAYANFADGNALIIKPAPGFFYPRSRYDIDLDFPPDYFSSIPPDQLDTSALLAGSISGFGETFPGAIGTFDATVLSVTSVSTVPLPGAALLFGSALLALVRVRAKGRNAAASE